MLVTGERSGSRLGYTREVRSLSVLILLSACAQSGTVPMGDRRDSGPADFGPIGEPDLGPPDLGVMDEPDMPPGPCDEGTSRACMSSCGTTGSSTCTDGTFGSCAPPTESCDNGTDDDCDGNVDEGTDCSPGATEPCNTTCGSAGTRTCGTECGWGSCAAPAETCNGSDDDCDGNVDETSACPAGTTRDCTTTCGSTGSQTCTASCGWPVCSPPPESCNGQDDDCDGSIDEGSRALPVTFTYSGDLAGAHPSCNGSTERIGTSCDAAFDRACAARACPNAGYGPIENSGDVGIGTCVVGIRHTVSWAALSASHPACINAGSYPPDCNAAIHRWCRDQGEVTGFGPTEVGAGDAQVVCTPWAEVVMTTYSTLSTHHFPCDGVGERHGPNCNAAIHRFCRDARGAVSGYGPIENSGDSAWVACIGN